MTMTCYLVSHTNYNLTYRCTADGATGDEFGIGNSGAATPDLDTDSTLQPLHEVVLRAAATNAAAEELLNSIGIQGAPLTADLLSRIRTTVVPIGNGRHWGIDAGSTGSRAALTVSSRQLSGGGAGDAIVYLDVVHSIVR
jgi:hypothetical protein